MTIGIEKIFFAYILKNKKHFQIIETFYFKNNEIKLVYEIIRKYMLKGDSVNLPSPKQILEMVSSEDEEGIITKDILKSLLTVDLLEYDEVNFIVPKFNAWILTNRMKSATSDIIDETRDLDTLNDYEPTLLKINNIKEIINKMSNTNFVGDEEDESDDFDDVENHAQDTAKYKVPTGIKSLDHIVEGGLDLQTLTVLMCESGGGKSIWMQNIATTSANLGNNILYISLEMSKRKVFKRIGSMRLKIPILDYDTKSMDAEYMKKQIDNMKRNNSKDLFDKKGVGKIICKFWPAGTACVNDFDDYIEKQQIKLGIKFNLIIIDYLTLMITPKGLGGDTLYNY